MNLIYMWQFNNLDYNVNEKQTNMYDIIIPIYLLLELY